CHEVCPITTGAIIEMREAVEAAGLGSQVAFVEATVDPGRDSPQRLRAYAKLTGANWALLTGTPAQVAALWQFFGVAYERQPIVSPAPTDWLTGQPEAYDVAHTDALFFLDEAGHERIVIAGGPDLGGRLDTRLSGLLDAQGRENLAHPQGAWTVPQALGNLGHLLGRSIAPPAP
ncbi:MAG: SCO family protein, partial [Candidatus Limnocylindrales bacterium]